MNSVTKKLAAIRRRLGFYQLRALDDFPDLCSRIMELTSARERFNALPDLKGAKVVKVTDNGCSNWIIIAGPKRAVTFKLVLFPKASGNIVILGEQSDQPKEIRFEGSNNLAICGQNIKWAQVSVRFISNSAAVCLGHGSIYNGTSIIVEGDGCGVEIGRDCLFAPGTTIRTSDLHGMYHVATGEWLNPPKPVVIEPHVWLGQDALVLKGSHIGGGSVIAARAVVNSTLPQFAVAAGAPAKAVRGDVCWSLARSPDPTELEAVRELVRRATEIDGTRAKL
jgi:acetyltransferase-like isoleucine patch superfamily enzyme